jgi:hypothetical protein
MAQRRLDLGFKTWRDLAQAADISYETLRALRKGEGTPAEATIHGLERALKWRTGSIAAVYDNRDPEPAPGSPGAEEPEEEPFRFDPETFVPQSAAERAMFQIYQATIAEQRAERAELQRKLREIDEKLDRLAGNSGDDGQARTA